MTTVNMLDAKTRLSQLVQAVENGDETEIVIARNGKPAARLVPIQTVRRPIRLGLAADRAGDYDFLDSPEVEAEMERVWAEYFNKDDQTGEDTVAPQDRPARYRR